MTKIAIFLILGAALLYVCVGVAIYAFQRTLLYFPLKSDVAPSSAGVPEADVRRLKTVDGETLIAWFVRRPGPYIAIYFHGNVDPLAGRGDRINDLADLGFSVLAVDYRGYGGSTGSPTETGLHIDADTTYDEALKLGFAADHVMLLGESLGSGVALELATRKQVAGIMLDSPYSSIVDVAAGRYWFLPVHLLMTDQFRSDLWIPRVHVPILILHGARDTIIPVKFGRRLADLGGPNVTYVEVSDGYHVVFDEDAAREPIRQWLKKFGI